MRTSVKLLLLIVFFLFSGNGYSIPSFNPADLDDTLSADSGNTLTSFQCADYSELAHGIKIETTVVSGPSSCVHNARSVNYRILQLIIYKQKENSFNSITDIFRSKSINRRSFADILRI